MYTYVTENQSNLLSYEKSWRIFWGWNALVKFYILINNQKAKSEAMALDWINKFIFFTLKLLDKKKKWEFLPQSEEKYSMKSEIQDQKERLGDNFNRSKLSCRNFFFLFFLVFKHKNYQIKVSNNIEVISKDKEADFVFVQCRNEWTK